MASRLLGEWRQPNRMKLLPNMNKLLAIAILSIGTLSASAVTITLTEVSSTELDYSWSDGSGSGKLITSTPDSWSDLIIDGGPHSAIEGMDNFWSEETSSTYNDVFVSLSTGPAQVSVQSDLADPPLTPLANGDTFTGVDFAIQFFDNAGASEPTSGVPDSGASVTLLGMALVCCCVVKTKFCHSC